MKIVQNDNKNTIRYDDVEGGEVFNYNGTLYIKAYDEVQSYGVCLIDGEIDCDFLADDIVKIHRAELHILD